MEPKERPILFWRSAVFHRRTTQREFIIDWTVASPLLTWEVKHCYQRCLLCNWLHFSWNRLNTIICIVQSTGGCSPWRPAADMGVVRNENTSFFLGFSKADGEAPDTARAAGLYGSPWHLQYLKLYTLACLHYRNGWVIVRNARPSQIILGGIRLTSLCNEYPEETPLHIEKSWVCRGVHIYSYSVSKTWNVGTR